MNMGDLVLWTIWAFFVVLTLVLYLRVDWHDWGLVGMTIALFGLTILVTMIATDDRWFQAETRVLWRTLVFVGVPVAVAGYVAGMVRDPIPRRQIIRRLLALAIGLALSYLVLARLIGDGS
jgi:ABC-type sugar transport system permease subunit